MVVRDSGQPGLCHKFGDCQSQRDVHGDGDRIFDDEHVQTKAAYELVQMGLEIHLQLVYLR